MSRQLFSGSPYFKRPERIITIINLWLLKPDDIEPLTVNGVNQFGVNLTLTVNDFKGQIGLILAPYKPIDFLNY